MRDNIGPDIFTQRKPMTISIPDACKLLGISRATLYRRIKSGELHCTRTAPDGVGRQCVTFTPAQLGMKAEQVTTRPAEHDVPVNKYYEESSPNLGEHPAPCGEVAAFVPRPLSPFEQQQLSDLEFSERFKAGEATDSIGNTKTRSSRTIIGPREPRVRVRLLGNEHMTSPTGNTNVPTNRINSDELEERWHPGAAERKEKMYADSGERQPSTQETKKALDHAAIAAAFRAGYSR
jgi:excisionase family DNA binding protein